MSSLVSIVPRDGLKDVLRDSIIVALIFEVIQPTASIVDLVLRIVELLAKLIDVILLNSQYRGWHRKPPRQHGAQGQHEEEPSHGDHLRCRESRVIAAPRINARV